MEDKKKEIKRIVKECNEKVKQIDKKYEIKSLKKPDTSELEEKISYEKEFIAKLEYEAETEIGVRDTNKELIEAAKARLEKAEKERDFINEKYDFEKKIAEADALKKKKEQNSIVTLPSGRQVKMSEKNEIDKREIRDNAVKRLTVEKTKIGKELENEESKLRAKIEQKENFKFEYEGINVLNADEYNKLKEEIENLQNNIEKIKEVKTLCENSILKLKEELEKSNKEFENAWYEARKNENEELEPEKVEDQKAEAEKAEPEKAEAEKVEAEKVEAEKAGPAKTESEKVETEKVKTVNEKLANAKPDEVKAVKVEPAKTESTKSEPVKVKQEEKEVQNLSVKIVYNAKDDKYVVTSSDGKKAKVSREELKRMDFERYAKNEELLNKINENIQYIDTNLVILLRAFDQKNNTNKLEEYINSANPANGKDKIVEEMQKNGISIEYNLKGLYNKTLVPNKESEEPERLSVDNISKEDRIELLRKANMHKEIGTAKVTKGIYVTIREAFEKIFNSNKSKLALSEGREEPKKEDKTQTKENEKDEKQVVKQKDIKTQYKVNEDNKDKYKTESDRIADEVVNRLIKAKGAKLVDKDKGER